MKIREMEEHFPQELYENLTEPNTRYFLHTVNFLKGPTNNNESNSFWKS